MMKLKRGLALFSAVLLFLLYGTSILCAFFQHQWAQSMLMASIFCSICLPVTLYGYTILLRILSTQEQNRSFTEADRTLNKTKEDSAAGKMTENKKQDNHLHST